MTDDELRIVNTTLESLYGHGVEERVKLGIRLVTSDERPRYRIVVAGREMETRKGRHEKFSEHHGEVVSSHDVTRKFLKYGNLIDDPSQLALEKLIFVPWNVELPETSGKINYEALWFFQPWQQDPPLIMKMAQLIIYGIENAPVRQAADYEALEKEKKEKRLAIAQQILDNNNPLIADQLHHGEAAVVTENIVNGEVVDAGDSN